MSLAYLVIPGARLPASVGRKILAECSSEELAALERIAGNDRALHEDAGISPAFSRAPHLVWLWKVLTHRHDTPQEAPWRWMALGGREQATQFWSVDPVTVCDGKIRAQGPELSFDEFMQLTIAVEPLMLKAGFRLQMWDTTWFATRKTDWNAVSAPRAAITALCVDDLVIEGPDGEVAHELFRTISALLKNHPVNIERRKTGKPLVDALWISGGGHEQLFFPPTLVRSVACNDAAVRGWANAAGILAERIGKDTGDWPEAPPGDVIAVIDGLYEPWLREDWDTWRKALPGIAEKVTSYREKALRFEAKEYAVVAFGLGSVALLAPAREKNIFKNLFANPRRLAPSDWCIEGKE